MKTAEAGPSAIKNVPMKRENPILCHSASLGVYPLRHHEFTHTNQASESLYRMAPDAGARQGSRPTLFLRIVTKVDS